MRENKSCRIKSFALLVVLVFGHEVMAQNAATEYTRMAPIEQYLMADRAAEIALARRAATGIHFTRCGGSGPRESWVRNSRQRQKRIRVHRGARVDIRCRS